MRGIDRRAGALVLVRPDQFVACVLPLGAGRHLADFLERILVMQPDGVQAAELAPTS